MNLSDIKGRIEVCIREFMSRDSALFDLGASEWSIAHRLAVYMESRFEGWDVDCEYNKVGSEGITKCDADGIYKRPDIIVHHRGKTEKEHNLLMVEIKINNSSEDDIKLREFTSVPHNRRIVQYQHGLALSFKPNIRGKWFPERRSYEHYK